MPQKQYLSTDPNAGQASDAPKYLSTDPNAGASANEAAPPPPADPLRPAWKDLAAELPSDVNVLRRGPAVAATIAGVLTGGMSLPASVAITAGAGGLGSIAKNALEYFQGARKTPGEVAADVATDAALQGGAQLVGGGLMKGAGKVGEALYRRALGPSKALATEFPDLVQAGIEQGANVTKAGLAKTEAARAASAAQARQMVADAAPTAEPVRAAEVMGAFKPAYQQARAAESIGKTVNREPIAARARQVAESFGGTPATSGTPERIVSLARKAAPAIESGDEAVLRANAELGPLANTIPSRVLQPTEPEVRAARQLGATASTIPRGVLNGPPTVAEPLQFVTPATPGTRAVPGGIDLVQAQARKEAAQEAAQKAYKAAQRGTPINDTETLIDEGLARAYRQAIEKRAPGVGPVNAQTQRLIGLTRAIEDANTRNLVNRAIVGGALGVGEGVRTRDPMRALEAAAGGALITDPRIMGATGIALARSAPGAQVIAPNVLRAALLSLMGNSETEPGASAP